MENRMRKLIKVKFSGERCCADLSWRRCSYGMMPKLAKLKRLDVRPLIARGDDVLPKVLKRIHELAADEGLALVAPFLPSPLIDLLASQGFASQLERGEDASWIVYFWRENE